MTDQRHCYEVLQLAHRGHIYGHIQTAEQRTIILQYGDGYTGRWWVGI